MLRRKCGNVAVEVLDSMLKDKTMGIKIRDKMKIELPKKADPVEVLSFVLEENLSRSKYLAYKKMAGKSIFPTNSNSIKKICLSF